MKCLNRVGVFSWAFHPRRDEGGDAIGYHPVFLLRATILEAMSEGLLHREIPENSMSQEKKSGIRTVYGSSTAGTLAFERNLELDGEIVACLDIVRQIRKDYKRDQQIQEGLESLEAQIQDLRASQDSEEEVRKKLDELMRVPLSEDKTLHLQAFRRKGAKAQVGSEEEYQERVEKMVRNTSNNTALLLLRNPGDSVLSRLLEDLRNIPLDDYKTLRRQMTELSQGHKLKHYNEKKKIFLTEWLLPFQQELGKPVEQMSEEEFQAALKQVEGLRNQKLEEMTHLSHLMLDADRETFRIYNRTMNPIVNGKDESFWGTTEVRDEFVELVSKLITRFSFSLEDRFLIFRTKNGGFCYLVGFSDDAFDMAHTTQEGKLALYPHLKVFINVGEEEYHELSMEFYNRNAKSYYSSLKTALVPLLNAAAVMVETELSEDLKGAFDMWL